MRYILFIPILLLASCSGSTEKLAANFEDMAQIAEDNADDCTVALAKLNAYLDEHEKTIRSRIANVGEGKEVDARRINVASIRLDKVVEACPESEAVQSFKQKFASMTTEQIKVQ